MNGTTTGVERANSSASKRMNGNKLQNGNGESRFGEEELPQTSTTEKPTKSIQKKYRHVAAVHSVVRPSCLSHDSDAAPSFIGFRNLMVIVLGEFAPSWLTALTGWLANNGCNSGGKLTIND